MTDTSKARQPVPSDFERRVIFHPAFDKRNSDPTKDYGDHGMEIRFVLKGPAGAVQWLCYTGWDLPAVQREMRGWRADLDTRFGKIHPEGYDLGYHSPTPRYEGHSAIQTDCEILGGPCYYDGFESQRRVASGAVLARGRRGCLART